MRREISVVLKVQTSPQRRCPGGPTGARGRNGGPTAFYRTKWRGSRGSGSSNVTHMVQSPLYDNEKATEEATRAIDGPEQVADEDTRQ